MRTLTVFLLALLLSSQAHAQFRGEEPVKPSVSRGMTGGGSFLGLFDADRFDMRHSVSVSYGMVGDQGLGLSMYTNSMRYKISDEITARADVSMMFTPFGSATSMLQRDISGIFLRNARVDYAPTKDFRVTLQYRNEPYSWWGNPYSAYSRGSMGGWFGRMDDDDWP